MTVTLLVGPIASGKSTYIRPQATAGAVIVNDDAIYTAIHGGNYTLYEEELKLLYKSTENHILTTAVAMGRDVVIDRPNLTRLGRARYIGIARAFDIAARAVVFRMSTPVEHAERRTIADPRGQGFNFWLGACQRQFVKYERPSEDEGLDEIIWL